MIIMMKTHKGTAKRFKITKKGKVKYHHAGKGHILTKKTSNRKRHMRKGAYLGNSRFEKTIKKLLRNR